MPRKRPVDDDLRRFAEEHILYEAEMLQSLGTKLMNRHHEDDLVVENALLQSFTVHTRLVLDFLYDDDPRHAQDAAASDYFDDGAWAKARPEQSERLASVPGRVGKEIVHLSYKRLDVDEAEKGWLVPIGLEILGTLAAWAHLVPAERLPDGWLERFDREAGILSDPDWEQQMIRATDAPSVPTQMLPPSS